MMSQTRQIVSRFSTCCQHYGRGFIKPSAVSSPNVSRSGRRYPHKPQEKYTSVYEQFDDAEATAAVQSFDHTLYPDINKLGDAYSAYDQEKFDRKRRVSQWRMTKKHFKECFQPEVSLLTYAEKEQMRYLHRTDPNEWSEENLSMSFPISIDGVRTLLRSPFRCLTVADIQHHDDKVAERLEKIRTGEIELSLELEEKMKIRKSLPIKLGATSTPELGLLVVEKPKTLGPFARMVTRDPNPSPAADDSSAEPAFKIYEKKPIPKWKQKEGKLPKDPIDVNEVQTLSPSYEESKMLSGMRPGRMTLKEFESEIQKAQESGKINEHFPDTEKKKLAFLLKKSNEPNHRVAPPPSPPVLPGSDDYVPTPKDFIETSHIQKFSSSSTTDDVEVNVEKGEAYIYKSDTGVQKPFAQRQHRIRLPPNSQKEGSVYRVGDSYYDENGEFLYRPV